MTGTGASIFESADWYDRGIDWDARLGREIPFLRNVMGPPGQLGLLDAGCGTGRHAVAMAREGYGVVGLDSGQDMLRLAAAHAVGAGAEVRWVRSPYETLADAVGQSFDGVYCIGNSLAAAGNVEAVRQAVGNIAAVLRPGGRLVVHVLNFDAMRAEQPCVRGPRISRVESVEYVSFRVFHFGSSHAEITNVTAWNDGQWRCRSHGGRVYPVGHAELLAWLGDAGLRIDACHADYQRSPFDPACQGDLIVVATRS